MRWQGLLNLDDRAGLAVTSTGTLAAQSPLVLPESTNLTVPASAPAISSPARATVFGIPNANPVPASATSNPAPAAVTNAAPAPTSTAPAVQNAQPVQAPADKKPALGAPAMEPAPAAAPFACMDKASCNLFDGQSLSEIFFGKCDACADDCKSPLGPTPFPAVNILNELIYGKDGVKDAKIKFGGWVDVDYTYNSSGHGPEFNPTGGPGIAPVMNRFGDEATVRQIGLMITRDLDRNDWSWGFNIIALAGADASFLAPTAGWYPQTNPRFGFDFTDLNLTFHMPILTEGGVDVKIGRQTTILGPMGALSWQRPLNSSDYAWYNEEEGRYTGISTIWHINKQLDWYNGIEFGWGTFFDQKGNAPSYITNVSYWLDEEAKETKVWFTVLTGDTTDDSYANTTVVELGLQRNWNRYFYTIIDTQETYSRGPVFGGPPPAGYIERAYDVYTYNGYHLDKCWDLTTRLEYYYDCDGQGYAGGFGFPKTSYYSGTIGLNYHPTKWWELRPEVRYDGANNNVFGVQGGGLHKEQLTVSADLMLKF